MAGSARTPEAAPPHESKSLFGRMFNFRHTAEAETADRSPDRAVAPAQEAPQPTIRPATAEDLGIGIPKFLLRQTSGTGAPQRR